MHRLISVLVSKAPLTMPILMLALFAIPSLKATPSPFGGPSNPSPFSASLSPFSEAPSSPQPSIKKKEKEQQKSLQVDFNLDYVVVKNHRIPTQEVFANELCILIAAFYRREELGKLSPESLTKLEFYLAHVYRSTLNSALKRRINAAVKLLVNFHKTKFDLEATPIPEKHVPTVEKIATELCVLIATLAREQELAQINYKPLTRILLYLRGLYSNTKDDLLKRRIVWSEKYLKEELQRRKKGGNLSKGSVGQPEVLPLGAPPKTGSPFGSMPPEAAQKRLQRLSTLAQQNLIDPAKLPPQDQLALQQLPPLPPNNPNSIGR